MRSSSGYCPGRVLKKLQKFLLKSLEVMKQKDVDLVYCNSTQIDENGKIIHEDYFKYKNVPLINGKSKLAMSRCVGIGCSQLITKYVKEKMIPFKAEVMAHDWLAAYIANNAKGMAYIKEPLVRYRRLSESITSEGRGIFYVIKWRIKNLVIGNGFKKFKNQILDFKRMFYDDVSDENKKLLDLFTEKFVYPKRFRKKVIDDLMLRILFLFGVL